MSVCFLLCLSFALAISYQKMQVLPTSKSFYFLVNEDTNVQVSIYESVHDGGAGYYIQTDEAEYVALNVYLSKAEGESVQSNLQEDYTLLCMQANDSYLTTRKQKKDAELLQGAFASLNGCIQVLKAEIRRLEQGATQQSSKELLDILLRQFAYLQKEYKALHIFTKWIAYASEPLKEAKEEIVYTHQLRYALCTLCQGYVELTKAYAL